MSPIWFIQIANVLGLASVVIAGRWSRWGWGIGLLSEPVWAYWAYKTPNAGWGLYPWCTIWSVMYLYNFIKWTGRPKGCRTCQM